MLPERNFGQLEGASSAVKVNFSCRRQFCDICNKTRTGK